MENEKLKGNKKIQCKCGLAMLYRNHKSHITTDRHKVRMLKLQINELEKEEKRLMEIEWKDLQTNQEHTLIEIGCKRSRLMEKLIKMIN